jgi:hypothetical protein
MKASRYPRSLSDFANLESLIEKAVIQDYIPKTKIIDSATIVRAQGSCFAANLTDALLRAGVNVQYSKVMEAINSPLMNRLLIERAVNPDAADAGNDPEFDRFADAFGKDMPNADVFILTLGLAYNWFNKETGRPHAQIDAAEIQKYEQRLLSVADNLEHIKAIVRGVRTLNPALKIVLTVSPVPLAADSTRGSAVVGDFLSKATLRLATEEYLKSGPVDVYYWPAFEIVRWLGAHLPPVFGMDDGEPRHVNNDMVEVIVRLFLKHFATLNQETA